MCVARRRSRTGRADAAAAIDSRLRRGRGPRVRLRVDAAAADVRSRRRRGRGPATEFASTPRPQHTQYGVDAATRTRGRVGAAAATPRPRRTSRRRRGCDNLNMRRSHRRGDEVASTPRGPNAPRRRSARHRGLERDGETSCGAKGRPVVWRRRAYGPGGVPSPRGSSFDESRRRRGRDLETSRSDAAAATWIFRRRQDARASGTSEQSGARD